MSRALVDRSEARPGRAVIEAIIDDDDIDEEARQAPLYEVIDLDALDELFRDGTGKVIFEYQSRVIAVDHDGTVQVLPTLDGRGDDPR
jgi:hypothetical protein